MSKWNIFIRILILILILIAFEWTFSLGNWGFLIRVIGCSLLGIYGAIGWYTLRKRLPRMQRYPFLMMSMFFLASAVSQLINLRSQPGPGNEELSVWIAGLEVFLLLVILAGIVLFFLETKQKTPETQTD